MNDKIIRTSICTALLAIVTTAVTPAVATACLCVAFNAGLQAQSSNVAVFHMTVEEVWTSEGFDMADGLSSVTGLAETADGALWISDVAPGGSPRVLLHRGVSPPGDTRVVGRSGDGPGEVSWPDRIAITPGGNVAVFDMGRGGVEVYSPTGEPKGRVQFPVRATWPKGFVALASDGFVVSGPIDGLDFAVHHFGPDGGWIRSWGALAEAREWRDRMIASGGALHALSDGSLLYSQGTPHRIVHYDPLAPEDSGRRERSLVALVDLLQAPGDDVVVESIGDDGQMTRSFNVTYPQSVAVFQLEGGLILNVVRLEDEDASLWQLFDLRQVADSGAALVAETRVGVAYFPLFRAPGRDVLAVRRDPDTYLSTVVRLRVRWEPM